MTGVQTCALPIVSQSRYSWWCEYNFRQGCRIEDFPDYVREFLHIVRLDRESFINWDVPIGKISRFLYRFNMFEKMKGSLHSKLKAVELFYDCRDYQSLKNQLHMQELIFSELGYSDELLDSFYVKPNLKVLKNVYTKKWSDKNYRIRLQDSILKNDKKKKYSELYLGFNQV